MKNEASSERLRGVKLDPGVDLRRANRRIGPVELNFSRARRHLRSVFH